LKELKALNLIEMQVAGYQLSNQGIELFEIIEPLGDWSTQWAENFLAQDKRQDKRMEQGGE